MHYMFAVSIFGPVRTDCVNFSLSDSVADADRVKTHVRQMFDNNYPSIMEQIPQDCKIQQFPDEFLRDNVDVISLCDVGHNIQVFKYLLI